VKRGKYILLAAVCLMAYSCQLSSEQRQAKEWKALNDTIAECSKKISNIVEVIQQSPHTSEETQKSLMHDVDSIERRMKQAIRNCMERNKDNELGKYLRENYREE
jgi:gas vesicle protein